MRVNVHQFIKACGKAIYIFARQTNNQIGMDMGVGFVAYPAQVLFRLIIILLAADERLRLRIKTLNANFELDAVFGKAAYRRPLTHPTACREPAQNAHTPVHAQSYPERTP